MKCKTCGGEDIEVDETRGDAVCVACGTVCEESTIVSAIEFNETGGSASVIGQFVSDTSSKPYPGSMHASVRSRYGFMRNSRETTLAKGKASITEVASRLRLQNHYVESAHRLFAFAVQKNFVQGRKTMHVVAVCLYIKCREDKSPHMLIDFSDALSVNVFTLGSCFLKFCRLLNIETPLIDPSLYIHRFAGRMDLGSKTQLVAQAALRIVARMKRDWIQTGRRPSGICAAALLIAARTNGFPRTQAEIVKVMRVCGMTVRTRLEEFESTPAAQLTLGELREAEADPTTQPMLELEMDPPAFAKGRTTLWTQPPLALKGEAGEEAAAGGEGAIVTLKPPDPRPMRKKSTSSRRRERQRSDLYRDVEAGLAQDREEAEFELGLDQEGRSETKAPAPKATKNGTKADAKADAKADTTAEAGDCPAELDDGAASEGDPDALSSEDEEELVGFVLSSAEQQKKGAIWSEMNKEYLADKAVRVKRAAEDKARAGDANDPALGGKGGAKGGRGRGKRPYNKASVASSAESAFEHAAAAKKMSKKINYEAVQKIFGPAGDVITTETWQPAGGTANKRKRRGAAPAQTEKAKAKAWPNSPSTGSNPPTAAAAEKANEKAAEKAAGAAEATREAPDEMQEVEETFPATARQPKSVTGAKETAEAQAAPGDHVEEEEEEELVEEGQYEEEYQDEVDW
eukprot:CAMPEP_0172600074 /NCGR_PEP_ID=MMETSP1068-20121228/20205_1 /TAXON_ID=35684 /ORGANISM="Pseudopedinella elastica, Strain CCMP716" /LENGTH=686 /DNA_ID=CAMNT_0013400563 /DNA_START=23 /DNA_END=2083 /DNA_ORIENTATION=-